MPPDAYDRRTFLSRAGVLGAVAAAPGWLLPRAAAAQDPATALRPLLQELARETYAGLAAFVLPGDDRYSALQGASAAGPGAVAARAEQLTMDTVDRYIAFPDRMHVAVGVAALRRMGGAPGVALPGLGRRVSDREVAVLDDALERALTLPNDASVPASGFAALLLNLEASMLFPDSVGRPGGVAPFAKLRWREKARVFEDLESTRPLMLDALREVVPPHDPAREDLLTEFDNLAKFISGALLSLPALGTFSEYAVFDPATRTLRGRPVGWDIAGYLPGRDRAVEGHDALLGYYRGRR